MVLVLLFSLWLGLSSAMPQGSLKRRIERALEESDQRNPDQSASSHEAGSTSASSRGSLRTRVRRATAAQQPPPDLPLLESLKRRWAQGHISSPLVQEFADGAARQGAQGMSGLAAVGSHGRNTKQMQSPLLRFSAGRGVFLILHGCLCRQSEGQYSIQCCSRMSSLGVCMLSGGTFLMHLCEAL